MKYDIQNIIERYDYGEPLEFVFFWGHHGKPNRMTKAQLVLFSFNRIVVTFDSLPNLF